MFSNLESNWYFHVQFSSYEFSSRKNPTSIAEQCHAISYTLGIVDVLCSCGIVFFSFRKLTRKYLNSSESKSGCSYLLDIASHIDRERVKTLGTTAYMIDATRYGNVSRFINHR